MTKLYATSVIMNHSTPELMRHFAGFQEAANQQEAKGKAIELAEKECKDGSLLGVVVLELQIEVLRSAIKQYEA